MTARSRWTRYALACVALGASSACSLLLPFNELSDGAGDAASEGDAGGRSGDASEGDASEGDAGVDSGPYPAGSWCATQATGMTLCDDFDFETTAFERWTANQFLVQGSATLSSVAESPPHALEVSLPALTAGTFTTEMLQDTVPPKPGTSTLSFSFSFQPVRPWDAGESGNMYIATIAQGPGIPRSSVTLEVGQSGTSLSEQIIGLDGGSTFPPFPSSSFVPAVGAWMHVTIDVDLASAKATVAVDGSLAVTLPLSGTWSPSVNSTVYLGDWYITQTAGFDVLFDDAVIRQH